MVIWLLCSGRLVSSADNVMHHCTLMDMYIGMQDILVLWDLEVVLSPTDSPPHLISPNAATEHCDISYFSLLFLRYRSAASCCALCRSGPREVRSIPTTSKNNLNENFRTRTAKLGIIVCVWKPDL